MRLVQVGGDYLLVPFVSGMEMASIEQIKYESMCRLSIDSG